VKLASKEASWQPKRNRVSPGMQRNGAKENSHPPPHRHLEVKEGDSALLHAHSALMLLRRRLGDFCCCGPWVRGSDLVGFLEVSTSPRGRKAELWGILLLGEGQAFFWDARGVLNEWKERRGGGGLGEGTQPGDGAPKECQPKRKGGIRLEGVGVPRRRCLCRAGRSGGAAFRTHRWLAWGWRLNVSLRA
jgi:hypothetical protein